MKLVAGTRNTRFLRLVDGRFPSLFTYGPNPSTSYIPPSLRYGAIFCDAPGRGPRVRLQGAGYFVADGRRPQRRQCQRPPASESEHQPRRPTPRKRLRRGSGAVKEGDFAKQTRPPHSAGLLV
jgi:hypothetical protein